MIYAQDIIDAHKVKIDRLRAELAITSNNLELVRTNLANARIEIAELAQAKARIAELEERFKLVQDADIWMKACWKAQGDTKRAEAERDALRRQMSDVGDRLECAIKDVAKRQYHIEVAITRVRAALNPSEK